MELSYNMKQELKQELRSAVYAAIEAYLKTQRGEANFGSTTRVSVVDTAVVVTIPLKATFEIRVKEVY